jgi:hypothetical protein
VDFNNHHDSQCILLKSWCIIISSGKTAELTTEYQLQIYESNSITYNKDLYGVKIPAQLPGQNISQSNAMRVEGSRDEDGACRADSMWRKDNKPQGDEEIPDPRNWQAEESVYQG